MLWGPGGALKGAVTDRDVKLEGGRQRHPSGGVSAKEMVIGLEGVELGADGKVRSHRGLGYHKTLDHIQSIKRKKYHLAPLFILFVP